MKRPVLVWTAFGAAVVLVLGVVLFFTAKMLAFERSMAEAQARAVLEENIRLALWRMDSAAALLLTPDGGPKAFESNVGVQQALNNDPVQRVDPQVQSAISSQEYQQRKSLNRAQQPAAVGAKDWQSIEPILLDRIRDILPGARLEPAQNDREPTGDARRLASIPALLVVPASALPPIDLPWNTPLRVSLMLAWACMLIAAAAVALLLGATLSLSERRGAFASAVTHELRTPLTTIRMYGEMLSTGMVGDEAARRQYMDTLVTESDRLGHMVENVLAYARLEKRLAPRQAERITLHDLVERCLPSLRRRAAQAGLSLNVLIPEEAAAAACRTDPVAAQQILLNLVDNACKFARTDIELAATLAPGRVCLTVADHGPGVGERAARLFTAFGKSRRDPVPGIGLGLYLSRQLARDTGGDLQHVPSVAGARFMLALPRCD